jgi:hypothetical protein
MHENFLDFFDKPSMFDAPEPPKFTAAEFMQKTKRLLDDIQVAYGEAYYNYRLTESDLPAEAVCASCKGCGTFGDNRECIQNNEEGECYERRFDAEHLSESLQAIMFEDSAFFDLYAAELKP